MQGDGYVKIAYFPKNTWKAHLGGECDCVTGNPGQNSSRITTYDQFYPSNHNALDG
jgi:hypothetical protein